MVPSLLRATPIASGVALATLRTGNREGLKVSRNEVYVGKDGAAGTSVVALAIPPSYVRRKSPGNPSKIIYPISQVLKVCVYVFLEGKPQNKQLQRV